MRTIILAFAFAAVALNVSAQTGAFPGHFEWPAEDAATIPDIRIQETLQSARSEARDAAQRAREARLVAGQARRLVALRTSIGRGPQPLTVGDGVIMRAVDAGAGPRGSIEWSTGAVLTGAVGGGLGEFAPASDSALSAFSGWVYGANAPIPTPMTGVFTFSSGDEFTGSYNAGSNARGIYVSSSGERRFIGEIDFEAGGYVPVRGQVEDRRGRVLAIVR